MENETRDSWKEWRIHVLKELERLNACLMTIDTKINKQNTDITRLKVQAGVWGAIAGAIPVVIAVIFFWLKYAGGKL